MSRYLFALWVVVCFLAGFAIATARAEPSGYVPMDEYLEEVQPAPTLEETLEAIFRSLAEIDRALSERPPSTEPVQLCRYIDFDSITYEMRDGKVVTFTFDTLLDACHRVKFRGKA